MPDKVTPGRTLAFQAWPPRVVRASQNATPGRFPTVTRLMFCALLLLPLTGCRMPLSRATPDRFTCSPGLVRQTMADAGTGQRVPARVIDAVFARLNAQPRAEVRETTCGMGVVSLRYVKPRRMQTVVWVNTGLPGRPRVTRSPRETQIGNRLGYVGHTMVAPWVGMGVTAHRLLLPDAWRGMARHGASAPAFYVLQPAPTFYMLPPHPSVRDLTLRRVRDGRQEVFVERWRGLLANCPLTVSCPAPLTDPRFFARYTAVLRVDAKGGLPISVTTVAQVRSHARGQFRWGRVVPVAQSMFRYGGAFSIKFVTG